MTTTVSNYYAFNLYQDNEWFTINAIYGQFLRLKKVTKVKPEVAPFLKITFMMCISHVLSFMLYHKMHNFMSFWHKFALRVCAETGGPVVLM